MRRAPLALLLLLACSKQETPPAPAPKPPPGGCQNIDTDGTCDHTLLPLPPLQDAATELRYYVSTSCTYDGGIAMSNERTLLVVPHDKDTELAAHYASHRSEPCHCTIVRPPCAPSLGISVRVDPPPYARVER